MKNNDQNTKKAITTQTAIILSFIMLVVGFVGGIVYSAFKMKNPVAQTSSMVASENANTGQEATSEQKKEVEELEKATEQSPENAGAWIALGNACFDYNMTQKAIHAYETALKYSPNNADVWTDLGIMYRRDGNSEKAVSAFDQAQKVSPGHEMSLFNKGIVLMHDLNDMPGALAAWEKLLQDHPDAKTPGGMPIKELVEKLKASMDN